MFHIYFPISWQESYSSNAINRNSKCSFFPRFRTVTWSFFFLPLSLTFFVFVNSKKVSKSLKIYILRPKLEMEEKKSPINFWLLCSFYVPGAGTKRFPFYLDERANNCRDMQTDLKRCSFIPFYLCITNQA